jgi:beta-glucosidase
MTPFKLPDNFLFGTSTSSLQIEGGDRNNSWFRWSEKGKIKDNSSCLESCNHWNLIDEDINLIKKINSQTYRMSIEWSRIEPQKGVFDKESINHYKNEIIKLKQSGILPLVTLHHFSNPLWFEDQNGWLNEESINLFERYTEYVVRNIGDIVSDWITINEPNVYLFNGYLKGIWPPGENNIFKYLKSAKNIILSHIKSYKKIHEIRLNMNLQETNVGAANHIRIFEAKKNKFFDKLICKIYDLFFHKLFFDGMYEGKIIIPFNKKYPYGKGKYFDFIGINYYSKDTISFVFSPKSFFSQIKVTSDKNTTEMGWEIYPEGLYQICKDYFVKYKIPIFITENGISDANDEKRSSFIYNHLYQIKKLIDEGIDVKRYYYWTLMDNFEWLEGYTSKFGLFSVDFSSQKRKIRNSGTFYGEISKNKEIDQKMIDKYINKKRVFDILISEND